MATAKKPAGTAQTRSTSTKTTAGAKKGAATSGRAAPSKAAATAKAPASKTAAKSATTTASKTAAKTAAKSATKTATKTAAKSAAKSATTAAPAKAAAKKAPSKAAAGKRGPNPAFMKPLQPDAQLAEVVGKEPMPRTQVVARVWDYIKKNGLQESRNINADAKLRPIFGKDQITMFEMMKLVNAHLSDVPA